MIEPKILGVCAWLAERFNFDVTGVRIAFVILTMLGVGTPILLYLVLSLIKPK
ncbi:MAG: phage shock protein C [Flavobacteriales bacterium]|jgi:phage shock protein C